MKSKAILSFVIFVLICSFSHVFAGVPKMINYQGKLTTHQGALISDTASMVFTIYDDSTSGTALWTETQDSVIVRNGVFSVLLGSENDIPDSVFTGSVRYLGVKVGDDSEMTPRREIVSVGYAYKAEYADTAEYAQVAVSDGDWSIDGDNIYRLNGNVGIGTASPNSKLEIETDSADAAVAEALRLFNPGEGPGTGASIDFYWHATDVNKNARIRGCATGANQGDLYLEVANGSDFVPLMVFDGSSGNVGIGTTNPQGKLDINGSLAVGGDEGSAGQVLTSQGAGTNPVWGDVIPNGSVSQAKLKTATVEVSGTANETLNLPGGQYCFSIQGKASIAGTNSWYHYGNGDWAHEHVGQMGTTYNTLVCVSALGGATVYVQARYVTSSGKDHWMFFLIDKDTKLVKAGYQAPDHPCYGSGGDENDIPHPFGSYDPQKHEVILVANNILPELKSKVTSKRSLLTIINEEYEIDFDSDPVYEPREIIEIDEYGDKEGEILQKIKTPEWAKILIGKDEIYLKRRLVETLPDYISYKKLKPKSEIIVESQILTQSSGVELDAPSHR